MRVTAITTAASPNRAGHARLTAHVAYDDALAEEEDYWIEVADAYAEHLSPNGSPWLALLVPLAMARRESLRVDAPVDATLFAHTDDLMRLWSAWFPPFAPVAIEVDSVVDLAPDGPRRTGAFFSGGVDSFFTLLRRERDGERNPGTPVDDLLFVWGFDVSLGDASTFAHRRDNLRCVAAAMGKTLIDMATNLRTTRYRELDWAKIGHGPALAALALAFEPRFRAVALASAREYPYASAGWGTHPVSDPMFSTGRMRVVHDGGTYNRVDKVCFIAQSELALRYLHVCWKSGSERNCGACEKCCRTMTTLAIVGALDRCATFPAKAFSVHQIARMYCSNPVTKRFNRSNHSLAKQHGRRDIAGALDRSLRLSKRRDVMRAGIRLLSRAPALWRLVRPLHSAVMRNVIQ